MQEQGAFEIKQVQQARKESEIIRPATPDASEKEVEAATSSCVNHLCGCKK